MDERYMRELKLGLKIGKYASQFDEDDDEEEEEEYESEDYHGSEDDGHLIQE